MEIAVFDTPMAAAEALAEHLAEWGREGSLEHMALSGGSSPGVLYDLLAEDYWYRLPWKHMHFYWGDERCVPPTSPQSNYGMARDRLFAELAVPEGHIHRMRGEAAPDEEARRYAEVLRNNLPSENGLPRFDLVLLGMGEDGHTASVFPDQAGLWDSKALCEVAAHPETGQQRLTLTGRVINNAARVVFLVNGKSKAGRVREIIEGGEKALQYPASRVAPTDGRLIWMLDREAASLLP